MVDIFDTIHQSHTISSLHLLIKVWIQKDAFLILNPDEVSTATVSVWKSRKNEKSYVASTPDAVGTELG